MAVSKHPRKRLVKGLAQFQMDLSRSITDDGQLPVVMVRPTNLVYVQESGCYVPLWLESTCSMFCAF